MQLLLPLLLLVASAAAFNQGGTSKSDFKVVPQAYFLQLADGSGLSKRGLKPLKVRPCSL